MSFDQPKLQAHTAAHAAHARPTSHSRHQRRHRQSAAAMALTAPSAAVQSSAYMQQAVRPIACSLLNHLRSLAAGQQPPSSLGRFLHTGWSRFGNPTRRMDSSPDAMSPKQPGLLPSPGVSPIAGAIAALSPKRSGLSTMPDTPTMWPSASGVPPEGPAAAAQPPPRGPQPPAAMAPLRIETAPSMTDLVTDEQQIILDPNTPRSPKHQMAEAIMTSGSTAQVLKRHMDAVVKVFATHSKPNFQLPWQRQQQFTSKSTGFAVKTESGERWLLTNAHSVSYSTQVQLKKRGDDEKYPATVLAIGTECDVALLTVDDDKFWEELVPLELGELPALQESVAVLGYPIGGDSLAISAGVVSRVQMTHYSHGCMSLLAVQTDAAINSGNSGGPVMNAQGQCVGIAFQSLTGDTQSVGYVIPTSVVRHFLSDVSKAGKYTGFPALNVVWQEMDSKALKRAYGMAPHQKGVLVRSVAAASHEASVLRPNDILLRIGGVEVGNDGSVPFRHGERVDFKYLVTNKHVGDTIKLDILRDGQEHTLEVQLTPYQYLVPPHLKNSKPSYFIVGGLVFTAASDPYLLQRYGSLSGCPVRLMARSYYGVKTQPDEQVVVLSSVLACDATLGYESTVGIRDSPIVSFNGHKVYNLAQLARLVTENQDAYMRFDLETANKVVIVDTEVARRDTAKIMEDHNIAAAMSKDIANSLEAWGKQQGGQGDQGHVGKGGADADGAQAAGRPAVVVTPQKGARPASPSCSP